MSCEIKHALLIKASSQKIFDAVSNPQQLNNWWTLESEGEPKMNQTYRLFFSPQYDWYGRVSKVISNKMFEIQMTDSDIDWNTTRFGFHFNETKEGTLVHFYHKGWSSPNYHFQHTSYCWALLLKGLKDYIEQGIIIPFEERA